MGGAAAVLLKLAETAADALPLWQAAGLKAFFELGSHFPENRFPDLFRGVQASEVQALLHQLAANAANRRGVCEKTSGTPVHVGVAGASGALSEDDAELLRQAELVRGLILRT